MVQWTNRCMREKARSVTIGAYRIMQIISALRPRALA